MIAEHTLHLLQVQGLFFLRAQIVDFISEDNADEILAVIRTKLNDHHLTATPTFRLDVPKEGSKVTIHLFNGDTELDSIKINVKDGAWYLCKSRRLITSTGPIDTKQITFKRLVQHLKPSNVQLDELQSDKLCEYVGQYTSLSMRKLKEFTFEVTIEKEILSIVTFHNGQAYDHYQLPLHKE